MRDEDKWPLVHAYRKAVELGEAPKIECPDCEAELVSIMGVRELPAFRCMACMITFHPALQVYKQMEENLREVNENMRRVEI